jgi:hypothetical protein
VRLDAAAVLDGDERDAQLGQRRGAALEPLAGEVGEQAGPADVDRGDPSGISVANAV